MRPFVIDSYLRGARLGGSAENVDFDGNTAVMAKRRYRDRWNRIITRRVLRTTTSYTPRRAPCSCSSLPEEFGV